MSGPSDADVVAALRVIATVLGIAPSTPDLYTQDRLPSDCGSRDAYLRRHRERMKVMATGWTRRGMVRAVTRAAWEADVAHETIASRTRTRKLVALPAPRDVDADLDRQLGIKTRAAR